MKLKSLTQHLKRIISVFAILNTKLTLCQAYHAPLTSQHLQQHYPDQHYHQHQFHLQNENDNLQRSEELAAKESESLKHSIYYSRAAANDHYHSHHSHHNHHQHFNDLHLKELTDSAKDPKNLRNGIYHDGAVTYDLGLPNYEILNPHDPPEIITPDHPHYEEQLNHIKKTNNFTIEDFGVTPEPDSDTIADTTSFASISTTDDTITTTEMPETTTTTNKRFLATATTSTTTPSPMKKYKNMKSDIEKHLSKTKEKLRILSDEMDLENKKQKISTAPAKNTKGLKFVIVRKNNNVGKNQIPTPFRSSQPNNFNYSIHQREFAEEALNENHSQIQQQTTFDTDLKFMKQFYGQSVLLPAEPVRSPSFSYGMGNLISPTPYYNRHFIYPPSVPTNYLTSANRHNIISYRTPMYRSPSLHSSSEINSRSSDSIPSTPLIQRNR